MITTVFFDLYGTLAGFYPSRFEVQSKACESFGISLTPEGVIKGYALADAFMADENATFPLRRRDEDGRRRFFAEYERLVLRGAGVEVTLDQSTDVWLAVQSTPSALTRYDDVLPTLMLLKRQGLVLGLISNMNRNGWELSKDLGLELYLDVTVTSVEVRAEKPDGAIFREALTRAGSEPQDAVHVGDQLRSDIEGARRAGIKPVLLDRDGNHPCYNCCPRIETLADVSGLLPGM